MSETANPLTPQELIALSRKADGPGLRRIGAHLGLLAGTGTVLLMAENVLLIAMAVLIHGVVMTFLFAPLHESVHRTAFRSRWLNRLAGWIGGAVLILPPRYFSHFHFAHHRHTQDPDQDPELLTPKPVSWPGYLWVLSGFEYWMRAIAGLVRRARGRVPGDFVPPGQRRRVILESRVFLAGYLLAGMLSAAFRVDLILWLWVIPALVGQPFLRAYLLAEHWGCPTVADMWRNTRSTVSNPLVRLLAWNMPYHAEHHAHASVPFHALPALSLRMREARGMVASGYGAFHLREVPALIRDGKGL
jgi:fatty acid desaturase